ncbi:MAG: IS21 family transposase, partial [Dehalococcoidia bacterium]|nr:IS21 family transposase [Dehalococcoidia bacterium]
MLRLKYDIGLGLRDIARSVHASPSTVHGLLGRVEAAKLPWPLPADLSDEQLEEMLYPGDPGQESQRPEPDWKQVHEELRRKGVTLQLLWLEYKQVHPKAGYQYSQFCARYHRWREKLDVVMRQTYPPGEYTAVDYAGPTVPVQDRITGEIRQACIFVGVLAASNYIFAEATWTQGLRDWIGSHCRMFEFFNGVTRVLVSDNLKSGVSRASRYEPELNQTYEEMARHYHTAVIPARPKKPHDKAKAKVEEAVQLVERWGLAVLRNRQFFSLAELNRAITEQLQWINNRPFQKADGTRRQLYETVERPALQPLPPQRYEFAEWRKATANIDYHVAVEHNFYSVPYQLVQEAVDVRLSDITVEVFHQGKRVASHPRCFGKGQYITRMEHRPASHQKHLEWSPSRLIQWAERVGPHTGKLVQLILESRPHPEMGYRSCLGLMRLGKEYTELRLEAACARAVALHTPKYQSVKSILQSGLDRTPLPQAPLAEQPLSHENVRG